MSHVDLGAGAEELGMDAEGARLGVLLDYIETMGWVGTDLFAHDASGGAVRRITARAGGRRGVLTRGRLGYQPQRAAPRLTKEVGVLSQPRVQ